MAVVARAAGASTYSVRAIPVSSSPFAAVGVAVTAIPTLNYGWIVRQGLVEVALGQVEAAAGGLEHLQADGRVDQVLEELVLLLRLRLGPPDEWNLSRMQLGGDTICCSTGSSCSALAFSRKTTLTSAAEAARGLGIRFINGVEISVTDSKGATYAAAGVDVEAGEHAVALMKASICAVRAASSTSASEASQRP